MIDIDRVRVRLTQELPGWSAQKKMAPGVDLRYRTPSSDHRKAGVMALLYPKLRETHLIIIERARSNPNDTHAGQLGFPGGKYEEEDQDLLTCALREVEEEIGIPATHIDVLGSLSELYVFASNFLVQPFVGFLNEEPSFVLQEAEVHDVHSVPISSLLDSNSRKVKDIQTSKYLIKNTPYKDVNGHTLWGATAMIASELEQVLREAMGV